MKMEYPIKKKIFSVEVTCTTYTESIKKIKEAVINGEPCIVDYMPVHGLMLACEDDKYNKELKAFDMICPDGQPVRWAMNIFHNTNLKDTVCGPISTIKICDMAAKERIKIGFYGSTNLVLSRLCLNLKKMFRNLDIVYVESPPYRMLNEVEEEYTINRINESGVEILFLGLGCPKQEKFAVKNKYKIKPVMLCVGAAFDFHAGTLKRSPIWMTEVGLEWLYRLIVEPRRLMVRYLKYNTKFVIKLVKAWCIVKFKRKIYD